MSRAAGRSDGPGRLERWLERPQRLVERLLRRSPDGVIMARGVFNLARQIARSSRGRRS